MTTASTPTRTDEPIRVATITVERAFDMNRPHESASQYHTVRVEPGTYPVELRTTSYGHRYLAATFSGLCTASGYGGRRYTEEEGKLSTVVLQPYKYELRAGKFWGVVTVENDAAIGLAAGV